MRQRVFVCAFCREHLSSSVDFSQSTYSSTNPNNRGNNDVIQCWHVLGFYSEHKKTCVNQIFGGTIWLIIAKEKTRSKLFLLSMDFNRWDLSLSKRSLFKWHVEYLAKVWLEIDMVYILSRPRFIYIYFDQEPSYFKWCGDAICIRRASTVAYF